MYLEKLNKLLEDIVQDIKSTKIITTDEFQLTLSSDNTVIYIDNITENPVLITELLDLLRDYVGLFVPSVNTTVLNSEDIVILNFDEPYNEEDLISAVEQYELINSDKRISIDGLKDPDIIF
jgi:hypothetical protein